jgi:hypothetical protein
MLKLSDFAQKTPTLNDTVLQNGKSGRVIATVFQTTQSFHQNGHYIPLCYRSNNPTHSSFLGEPGMDQVPTKHPQLNQALRLD